MVKEAQRGLKDHANQLKMGRAEQKKLTILNKEHMAQEGLLHTLEVRSSPRGGIFSIAPEMEELKLPMGHLVDPINQGGRQPQTPAAGAHLHGELSALKVKFDLLEAAIQLIQCHLEAMSSCRYQMWNCMRQSMCHQTQTSCSTIGYLFWSDRTQPRLDAWTSCRRCSRRVIKILGTE